LTLFVPSLGATALSAQTAQTPPAQPAAPPLTIDRDPVPSPDPDPAPGTAQQTAPEASSGALSKGPGGKYTLRQDAYEVRLNATVLDSSGRSVLDLNKDAFHVYEDGVPQTVASFRHEDLPVSLGILIDSSGSMYDKRAAVNQAALDLVKLSNPADEAFLVDFSWEAFIDQDFTSDTAKLQQGLGYIKSSGGTAIYDALVASADYLAKNAKHPKQVHLVVLFGSDTDKSEARHARRVLEALAEQTGGVAYFPKNLKEVDPIASEVAQDIRTQYTIAYHSTKSPTLGGYRQIHVDAKEKGYGKLQVRTRSGYFPKVDKPDSPTGTQ
jgi:Mg-chelatase subunit ChlD